MWRNNILEAARRADHSALLVEQWHTEAPLREQWPPGALRRERHARAQITTQLCRVAIVVASVLVCSGRAAAEPVECKTCHAAQAPELAGSVHHALRCNECHKGPEKHELSAEQLAAYTQGAERPTFDHGEGFVSKPARVDVPKFCGECHEDVMRMNPFGLRTDPLARYWTSNHGQRLQEGDTKVAVCIDCHGSHVVLAGDNPESTTYPLHIPDTCGKCHADAELMAQYNLSAEVVTEYRKSVHGHLLYELKDTGAPTCATCHDNHAAVPPGFADVGAVCGKCHTATAEHFSKSVHASLEGFKGCVQCHGGGPGSHSHLIEKITKPAGVMLQRYAHLLRTEPAPTAEEITAAIHEDPKQLIDRVMPTCGDCHDAPEEDESIQKLYAVLDEIAKAERTYVRTGQRLEEMAKGVVLVERQRFLFQDAKTHLVELAPLQHTLDLEKVKEIALELENVCGKVNTELDELDQSLAYRQVSLVPIFAFAVFFSGLLYVKFKRLKHQYVKGA